MLHWTVSTEAEWLLGNLPQLKQQSYTSKLKENSLQSCYEMLLTALSMFLTAGNAFDASQTHFF